MDQPIEPASPLANRRASLLQLLATFAVVAITGCQPPIEPPFKMPYVGAPTDTNVKIGDMFPTLEAFDLERKPIKIGPETFGEKATLIIFWGAWCDMCMREMAHEVDLANYYKEHGLKVIGINSDQDLALAHAALTEFEIPWPNVDDAEDRVVEGALNVQRWPSLFLLDSEGRIISSTPYLRELGVETDPVDRRKRRVNALDWTLQQVLIGPDGLSET